MDSTAPIPNHKPINDILQRASKTREKKLKTKQNRKRFNIVVKIWTFLYMLNNWSYYRIFMTEFLGTFVFMLVVNGVYFLFFGTSEIATIEQNITWHIALCLAIALVLYVDLLLFSEYFSPAFNPIVTMIYLFLGMLNIFQCIWQVLVQLLAAFCSSMSLYFLYDLGGFITISDNKGNWRIIVSEAAGTFFFGFSSYGGLLFIPSMAVNPAIVFSRMFLPGEIGNKPVWFVYYTIAEFIGALIGYFLTAFFLFPSITDPYRHKRISEMGKKIQDPTEDEETVPLTQEYI
ncbi:Aquaporin [Entamoeba marina]